MTGTVNDGATRIDEIGDDIFRISTKVPPDVVPGGFTFNPYLIRDDSPLLFHTGLRGMFPEVREAVGKVIDAAKLGTISFSHFESDECGALHEWLSVAPKAEVVCSDLGAMVSVNDFIGKEARGLADGGTFTTGKYRFRFCRTPHLPHGWDAGVLFEETEKTLLCSDLFHQTGDLEPITSNDVVGRSHEAMKAYQAGILADYVPYTPLTAKNLAKLADLKPKTLAIMHGSSFTGDCARALDDLHVAFRDVFGREM